jgi:hypothetical protein
LAAAFLVDKVNYRHFMASPEWSANTLAHFPDMAAERVRWRGPLPFDFAARSAVIVITLHDRVFEKTMSTCRRSRRATEGSFCSSDAQGAPHRSRDGQRHRSRGVYQAAES